MPPVAKNAVVRDAPATRKTWGNVASLPDHFARHGADFSAKSQDDYAAQAWRFRERASTEHLPMKFDTDGTFENARPNKGHMAIAKLVRQGKVSHVVTQNVDNLHQASGIPPEKIIELHGNATYALCLSCRTRYEIDDLRRAYLDDGAYPGCGCGGVVKTATISFGQSMPEHEMLRARDATLECDLFLSIGSSLVVYPAAGFPIMASRNGAALVILNRDPTDLDDHADLVINDEIGPVMAEVVGLTNADMGT